MKKSNIKGVDTKVPEEETLEAEVSEAKAETEVSEALEDTGFENYPEYKDSGVSSLGIPTTWEFKRFRDVFTFSKGLNITKENLEDEGIPCVNYGEIHSKYGFEVDPSVNSLKCVHPDYLEKSPKSILKMGDFVFADTSEDIEGSGNFTYLNSSRVTFAGYHTVIARTKKTLNNRFIAYVFESLSFRNQVRKRVKGVKVYSITNSILKDTTVWFPSDKEQTAIAQFLDDKIAKTDQTIAQKERLIELLKERKQALIQQAVTKGLDPTVKMKDSGIAWIGEIPEHWEVKRLKYILKERNERSVTGEEPLLMVSQIHGLVIRSDFHSKAEVAETTIGNKIVYHNDLVFNKLKAHLGVFFKSKINFRGLVSPDYAVYYSKGLLKDLKLLEILFRHPAYISQFIVRATGIVEGLIRLYTDDLFDIKVPLAPAIEQSKVLTYINDVSEKYDKIIKDQISQIQKLKEYKASLIDAAVTGKIKVC